MKQNKKNSERPRKLKFNAYAVSKKELKITRQNGMPFVPSVIRKKMSGNGDEKKRMKP